LAGWPDFGRCASSREPPPPASRVAGHPSARSRGRLVSTPVVEGSVRREAGRLRISVQLIHARTRTWWARAQGRRRHPGLAGRRRARCCRLDSSAGHAGRARSSRPGAGRGSRRTRRLLARAASKEHRGFTDTPSSTLARTLTGLPSMSAPHAVAPTARKRLGRAIQLPGITSSAAPAPSVHRTS
jgi:hypothetical protein